MRLLFKILGLLFILTVSTAFGFLKAAALKKRQNQLLQIKNGLLKLKEQLRMRSGNKQILLNNCFPFLEELITLKYEDKTLWNNFLADFGKGDTKQEHDRCESYIALFDNAFRQARNEYNEQQKLYKCLGVLSGIFICIFII